MIRRVPRRSIVRVGQTASRCAVRTGASFRSSGGSVWARPRGRGPTRADRTGTKLARTIYRRVGRVANRRHPPTDQAACLGAGPGPPGSGIRPGLRDGASAGGRKLANANLVGTPSSLSADHLPPVVRSHSRPKPLLAGSFDLAVSSRIMHRTRLSDSTAVPGGVIRIAPSRAG